MAVKLVTKRDEGRTKNRPPPPPPPPLPLHLVAKSPFYFRFAFIESCGSRKDKY